MIMNILFLWCLSVMPYWGLTICCEQSQSVRARLPLRRYICTHTCHLSSTWPTCSHLSSIADPLSCDNYRLTRATGVGGSIPHAALLACASTKTSMTELVAQSNKHLKAICHPHTLKIPEKSGPDRLIWGTQLRGLSNSQRCFSHLFCLCQEWDIRQETENKAYWCWWWVLIQWKALTLPTWHMGKL